MQQFVACMILGRKLLAEFSFVVIYALITTYNFIEGG